MSVETKTIDELRDILLQVPDNLYINDKLNRKLYCDARDTIMVIGERKLYELKDLVYKMLECPDEYIREEAVSTLGYNSRLFLPEFKDKAYELWNNDPGDEVRRRALSAWGGYYAGTGDSKVLKICYGILKSKDYEIDMRVAALDEIYEVDEEYHNATDRFLEKGKLLRSHVHEEFESKVDWDAIHAIMKKYAPEALDGS